MNQRQPALLLHPLFLSNLALLLLNDFFLKYQHHNWLTGKISDFAGLFVFSVFWTAFFPSFKKQILLLTAILFIWWKSPLSQPLINFLDIHLSIPLHRVVDYSDLAALVVLPFAFKLTASILPATFKNSFVVITIGIISLISFCATSMPPREIIYYPYRENEVRFNEIFLSPLSEQEVLNKLDPRKAGYRKDSIRYYKVTDNLDLYYMVGRPSDSLVQWLAVSQTFDSVLFVKRQQPAFYTIPQYILEGDTLLDLEVSILPSGQTKKSSRVVIESFQAKNGLMYKGIYDDRLAKTYKKHFRRLFKK